MFSDTLNKGFILGEMQNCCNKNYQTNDLWSFEIKEDGIYEVEKKMCKEICYVWIKEECLKGNFEKAIEIINKYGDEYFNEEDKEELINMLVKYDKRNSEIMMGMDVNEEINRSRVELYKYIIDNINMTV